MSAFSGDGDIGTSIVVHVEIFSFTHRPRISCIAAGRFVSSLFQGAAPAGRCVRLAEQRAVGAFFFHGRSVRVRGLGGYGEFGWE